MAEQIVAMLDRWTLTKNTSVKPTQFVISDPDGRLMDAGEDEQRMTAKFHDYVFSPGEFINRRVRTIPCPPVIDLLNEDTPPVDELRRALFELNSEVGR